MGIFSSSSQSLASLFFRSEAMHQIRFGGPLALALATGLCLAVGSSFSAAADTVAPPNEQQPTESIKMFAGIKAGQIEVKFIPKDSTQGRIFIKNNTDKPLRVELPKSAGAVQILAQIGGGMGGMGGGNRGGMGGGMQSMGMGMGGGGMRGGMGGGMFNVAPEKVAEVKVPCVCLEHGKAEPRPTATYQLQPIESVTTKPGVRELCSMLGQLPQRVAQAAAWHLNNNMSWQQLAAKRVQRADGSSYPYFNLAELKMAMSAAQQAIKAAESQPKTTPPTSPVQTVSQSR
jgi:hypothetical protein